MVAILGFVFKVVFKPSKAQLTLFTNVLLSIASLIVSILREYNAEHKEHIDNVKSELALFKNKINTKKVVLG